MSLISFSLFFGEESPRSLGYWHGATENAGLELNGPNVQGWKMSEWRNAKAKYKGVIQARHESEKYVYAATIKWNTHNMKCPLSNVNVKCPPLRIGPFLSIVLDFQRPHRHQILTHVRRWPELVKLGQKFVALPPPKKNGGPKTIKIWDKFRTTSLRDRQYLQKETIHPRTENGVANCNLSCARALNLVNFSQQTAKNRTGVLTDLTRSHYTQYTPPTRFNSTAASRRRCVLGFMWVRFRSSFVDVVRGVKLSVKLILVVDNEL